MTKIDHLTALEILDSRGRPTVKAYCAVDDGPKVSVSVPSGASTGAAEAHELRDGDMQRYEGLGCLKAVANVNNVIAKALTHATIENQAELDKRLIELDGTPNKSHLGANAILAVSLAFARACAAARSEPLYQSFGHLVGNSPEKLPRVTINLFSGGKHAGQNVPIQDVLLVPLSPLDIAGSLAMVYKLYQVAARETLKRYGMRLLRADEGGLAPPFASSEEMLDTAVDCMHIAGYVPGVDVAIAVDVASSHFHVNGGYHYGDRTLTSAGMTDVIAGWVDRNSVISVEDGLAEDDWPNWPELRKRIEGSAQVIGDDFLCTNPVRIRRAIDEGAANALLLKVNQIGTLTEAAEAFRLAKAAGWRVVVSARSGETEDDWLADLAVGWGADQIKIGSITQSERLAKYNRLLEIEAEGGWGLAGIGIAR